MTTASPLNLLVDQLTEMIELFREVGGGAGFAPLLLLVGALLVGFSVAFVGFLTAGAAVDLVTRR